MGCKREEGSRRGVVLRDSPMAPGLGSGRQSSCRCARGQGEKSALPAHPAATRKCWPVRDHGNRAPRRHAAPPSSAIPWTPALTSAHRRPQRSSCLP